MISDSIPWKDDLLRIADRLEGRTTQRRWTERTSYLVERDAMIGAFSVRKLLDSHKVSQRTAGQRFAVQQAEMTGQPADPWTAGHFFENYAIDSPVNGRIGLRDLTNQLIHSLVFFNSATEDKPHRFDGIIVASDHSVGTRVFFVPVGSLVSAFRSVASDEPMAWKMTWKNGRRHIEVL